MQVQLKQLEIVEAIKHYIAGQGINITGKEISISFTRARKEGGLTADVDINDVLIPGYSDAPATPEDPQKPTLSVVAAVQPAAEIEATTEPAPVAKTSSLFS